LLDEEEEEEEDENEAVDTSLDQVLRRDNDVSLPSSLMKCLK
jgi:hypothetical protein